MKIKGIVTKLLTAFVVVALALGCTKDVTEDTMLGVGNMCEGETITLAVTTSLTTIKDLNFTPNGGDDDNLQFRLIAKMGVDKLPQSGMPFYRVVPARVYAQELMVSVSSNDHLNQIISTSGPATVQPSIYLPDEDLHFAENFHAIVYGSDIVTCRAVGSNNAFGVVAPLKLQTKKI